jgi:hypothetical protein
MGLLPKEFYEMEIEDFALKAEGFLDHKDWLEASLRRIAAIIQSGIPYEKKPPPMEDQWPMRKDKENKVRAKKRTQANAFETLKKLAKNYNNIIKETGT